MKVLFTHSYFLCLDDKQQKTHAPYAPLATLYAAALLRKHGFTVQIADLQFASSPEEIKSHIDAFAPDVFVIYDDSFNYLTKMCLTNMREAAFKMQGIAHAKGIPVVVSSSDASDHLEKYFDHAADYIIIGEAEQTLLELLKAISNNQVHESGNIKGLAYRENNVIQKTPARVVLKDLDELPEPAWDLLDLKPYKNTWLKHHSYFSINFVTTRGCPYKCNWCAKPVYGNRYNSHSAQAVVTQLKKLQAIHGFTHVWFADDIFGLKPGWIKEFSRQVKAQDLTISYKIQSRADLLLTDENIRDLAESGCNEVWMGAESGSQRVLDAMDKGITVEQIKTATGLLKKHGILPCFFLQFGYLGEEMRDIAMTVKMLDELKPHDLGISVSYPLPGTKFYELVKSQLLEKQNWKDSDDLHLMFQSTYRPEFYKLLQRFVHYRFRTQQAWLAIKNKRFNKRAVLGPYYLARQLMIKSQLKTAHAAVANFF